jgi:wobble nucleotide-excising tRNase
MIRSILKLQNVGLLQDATQSGAVSLTKVCGVYADNGRGKSTLASVLRACGLADAGRLNARRTIDSPNLPEVKFLLPSGAHVEFTNNAWVGSSPRIVVFDSEFVEENVYSGFEVRAEQRQSLLEFALGDQAVAFKKRIDQLTVDIESQTRRLNLAQKELSGYAPTYTVAQFIAVQPVADAQQQIETLRKRIDAAKSAQQLGARQVPSALTAIAFEVQGVFDLLRKQLQDVEETAEAVVKAHLVKHGGHGLEDWVSRGQAYLTAQECPFCGQKVNDLALIKAYQSHFNKAYTELKRDVAALGDQVATSLADNKADKLRAAAETNTARIEAWKDRLELTTPVLAADGLSTALTQAREILQVLITKKRSVPLEAVGSESEQEAVTSAIDTVHQIVAAYNNELATVSAKIMEFKQKLATENVTSLESEIKGLEATIQRQQPTVVAAVAEYQAADTERTRLQSEKTHVREQSDALMTTTLQSYQTSINTLLATFGAEFSIEELGHTSVGSGEPRTEYALSLRNKSVKLGSRADLTSGHSFATTLSEADKRTLAFAFFVARLKADSNLSSSVIVLDDPVSSLDRNRRYQSIRQIAGLVTACGQLIVLSHDAYFVRELRDCLANLEPTPVELRPIRIGRVQSGYSAFATCDLDDICSSDYYRHHRLVADYVDGKPTSNTREVAKAIRPLMEGYYHRRFPGRLPKKTMFGRVIELAAAAQPPDPLAFLQPILGELSEVNEYAKQFHHDGGDSLPISDPELLQCAKKALDLIYRNG